MVISAKEAIVMKSNSTVPFTLHYLTLRTVTSPEDKESGRKRYCGIAKANEFFDLNSDENVRGFLGTDEEGRKRKATLVNKAIRDTINERRDLFPALNSGLVIVARSVTVDDDGGQAKLHHAGIINGAQTNGVVGTYFKDHPEDTNYPSVNFELIVTDDEELIADISIARNFQNRVNDLSIYGRQGLFDELERVMQQDDPLIMLRKSETDFGDDYVDTEKLIQVLTVILPSDVAVPSAEKSKKTPETLYRVYAYRHRSRCLKDFATVMEESGAWPEARNCFLDLSSDAWTLYTRLKSEQSFSGLQCVTGIKDRNGQKVVTPDGVPDGIVFPILSALSRFIRHTKGGWKLDVPKGFPWKALYDQARIQETTTAHHDPQTMGKRADCYVALRGAIDMYFAVSSPQ